MSTMPLPRIPKIGPVVAAQVFIAAASILAAVSASMAIFQLADGDFKDAVLLGAVAIFTAWMATAIAQFQSRLEGIDEVIRQGRERMERTEAALEEMRTTARRLRTSAGQAEKAERRTVH